MRVATTNTTSNSPERGLHTEGTDVHVQVEDQRVRDRDFWGARAIALTKDVYPLTAWRSPSDELTSIRQHTQLTYVGMQGTPTDQTPLRRTMTSIGGEWKGSANSVSSNTLQQIGTRKSSQ